MWPEFLYPDFFWPEYMWPVPNEFTLFQKSTIRTRRFLKQRWFVTLINASGTRYELGWVDIEETNPSIIDVPGSVPDGSYDVEVQTAGLAWKSLVQKNTASITIDSTGSEPIISDHPLFTNFRYEIVNEWLELLWDGDIPLDQSGLVSAGIWLTNGVPDFGTDPDIIIPLFSFQSEHKYVVRKDLTFDEQFEGMYWDENYWYVNHWINKHWYEGDAITYAGLAPMDSDDVIGPGQSIVLPNRSVLVPTRVVEEG